MSASPNHLTAAVVMCATAAALCGGLILVRPMLRAEVRAQVQCAVVQVAKLRDREGRP